MQMSNSERDTLEVISFLKQEDSKKDEQVTNTNSVMTLRLNGLQYGVMDNSYQLNLLLDKSLSTWYIYSTDFGRSYRMGSDLFT